MAIWSAFTNAVGGAFKNLGDMFGGDPNQSFMDRMGKGLSAAFDLGAKAPADLLGMAPHAVEDVWKGFVNLDQRAYTDIISHPLSDMFTMAAKVLYSDKQGEGLWGGIGSNLFSKQAWIDSWQQSNHYSPGQAIMLASNNLNSPKVPLAQTMLQQGMNQDQINQLENSDPLYAKALNERAIDPSDPQAVEQMLQGGGWGYRLGSGVTDGILRTYLDPANKVIKTTAPMLKVIKNNPVKDPGDVQKVMNLPRTQRFVNWTVGKSAAEIAEHPVLRKSAYRWTVANALSGAKNEQESAALFRTLIGDKSAYEELLAANQALAFRNANLMAPASVMEKWGLASGDMWDMVTDWLSPVEKSKAASAQAALNSQISRYNDILKAAGSITDRTSSSAMAESVASARTALKYSTKRAVDNSGFLQPARLVSTIKDHAYNTGITVYHALTDKPAMGFINHGDDSAPDQVRSWLNKSKVLTPQEKTDYAQRYASMTRDQRAAGWTKIEDEVYNKVAQKYNLNPSDMAHVLNQTRMRQDVYSQGAKSGAYGVISTPNGQKLHLLATATGEVITHPDLITQLQRGAVPMTNLVDIERAINRMDSTGTLQTIRDAGAKSAQHLTDVLDNVYGVWKPLSLMSMHRAYNHIGDDLLRGAAKLGGMATIADATDGAANWLRNRMFPLTKNMWVRNQEAQWEQSVNTAKAQAHGLAAQALDQKRRMAAGEVIPKANQVTTQDVLDAHARYRYTRDNRPTFIREKHRLGTGSFVVPGTRIRVEEAFGGPNSDYWRQLTSSEQFFHSQINDPAANMYQALMTNSSGPGFDVIHPSDNLPAWTKAYRHYVNNQLSPDPVAKALIQGKDPALVEKWLSESPQGQQHMRMLHKADTHALVQAVQDHVDKYLPTQWLKDAALSRKGVGVADINRTWKTASQMPEVNGNLNLMMHGGHPAVLSLKNTTNKLLKLTGTMPDDIMVRHPIFNRLYKARVTPAIQNAAAQAPMGKLTTAEIGRIQTMAMTQARKDLQNLVYDTSRFNDAGHLLRFVSPFFNAWFNAMTSWSSLFMENPALFAKAAIAKDAIWNNPYAVDTSTGEKATNDTPLSNLAIVAHMPKPVASLLGAGDLSELPIAASTLVSPTYADSIGNPGFGPLVQIPVNQLAKMSPSVAEDPMVQTILGSRITANSLQSAIPTASTQLLGMLGIAGLTGQSSDALNRASLTWSIYQEQMYDYHSGLRSTPPNIQDVQGQAAYVSALDTVLNRLMPLGFKPQASHQFYVDQYHNMITQNNGDVNKAQQEFVNKYGEQAYVFTQSLGKNTVDVPATANGIKAYKRYEGIISKDPSLAPVVIGVQGAGNFDEMAYQWEVANGLRTYQTPEEAAVQANVGQGWYNYQQTMAKINTVLQNRGLTSINQAGAKDLKDFKTAYVQSTNDPNSPYYNPDWYVSYGSFNKNQYAVRIDALEKLATDPALVGNPARADIRALNQYFQLRDQAEQYMQGRSTTSIKATQNRDVANWFDYKVAQLKQDNTQFSALWERYLKDDDLSQP
jgi:hypothetical protein